MELEFLWKLAHQLDKETFFEVHDLLEEITKIGEDDNLFDLLERKRISNFETLDEFSSKFGITKQGYYQWKRTGNVPHKHVSKVAEYLNMNPKEATELNFKKTYNNQKH